MIKSKAQQERDRTEILRYLSECGLLPVTPESIGDYLDDILRVVSEVGVAFHLRYMRDRKWVDLGEEKIRGKGLVILWARITADGVDEFDRRARELGEMR
jgi:hypothetical protein